MSAADPVEDPQTAGLREAAALQTLDTREALARSTQGRRRINLIWEATQSILAVGATLTAGVASIYLIVWGDPTLRTAAFTFLSTTTSAVVGFYFSRTNQPKTGGVQTEQHGGE